MTRVEISRKSGHIVRVYVNGHTGYAEEGEDIVCASLSSIVQTALLGLLRVAGIQPEYVIEEQNATLEIKLPTLSDEDRNNADMILETMLCGIADLYEGYSDFIDLEVK